MGNFDSNRASELALQLFSGHVNCVCVEICRCRPCLKASAVGNSVAVEEGQGHAADHALHGRGRHALGPGVLIYLQINAIPSVCIQSRENELCNAGAIKPHATEF